MPQDDQPQVSDEDVRKAIDDLEALKGHNGWKILMHRLATESEIARDALVEADAGDTQKIESLQREVKRLNWFGETLDELLKVAGTEELQQEPFDDA